MATERIKLKTIEVPTLGFGTYRLNGKEGINAMEFALHTGYRHIDTAQFYDNEGEVGQAMRQRGLEREAIFVTTKIFPPDFRNLLKATGESLKKLKTDYVDLLLLHWPSDDDTNKRATDLLFEAQHKGYTRSIGVSNFTLEQLAQALRQAPVICNQVEYHPFLAQDRMLEALREKGMMLTAYSPLAKGKVASEPVLQEIALRHQRTAGQIALRWLIQQGDDISVIPKASSEKRIRENFQIFDFTLSDDEMRAIFSLTNHERIGNPQWAPKWD